MSALGDLASGGGTIAGVGLAIGAYKSWREELRTRRRVEAGENLIGLLVSAPKPPTVLVRAVSSDEQRLLVWGEWDGRFWDWRREFEMVAARWRASGRGSSYLDRLEEASQELRRTSGAFMRTEIRNPRVTRLDVDSLTAPTQRFVECLANLRAHELELVEV